ncbi:MAG: sugar transferase [Lachnospiraceae bacterium]|nr:sugar transferase [Lachnospiraceae bacterium]
MKRSKYLRVKRYADCLLAVLAVLLLWPLFLAICVAIKLDSKGSVFFTQKRVGYAGRLFDIYKFRTMYSYTPRDVPTHMLKDPDEYITGIGAFLRRTSLDELPQIINIIKGDMSFVGPRPALWNQYDLIRERSKYRANRVPPGLTGLAQINGRDELEISEKARIDGMYAKNFGPVMDIRCLFGSVIAVMKGIGVREGGTGGR